MSVTESELPVGAGWAVCVVKIKLNARGLITAAFMLSLSTPVLAQIQAIKPEAVRFHLGDLDIIALHDGDNIRPNDASKLGIEAGAAGVQALVRTAGEPGDQIGISYNVLLLRNGPRVILVDTGIGPGVGGVLIQSLAAAGVSPAEVTDILITHSHFDHIGGLLDGDGRPAFANAKIHMSKAEWAFLQTGGTPSFRRFQGRDLTLQPKTVADVVGGSVVTFAPGDEILPGVASVDLPGHTPGHCGYEITSGTSRLLVVGDMVHHAVISLAGPQWTDGFDGDTKRGIQTRVAVLRRLAASSEWVFSPHFQFPGVGQVKAKGSGFVWEPTKPQP